MKSRFSFLPLVLSALFLLAFTLPVDSPQVKSPTESIELSHAWCAPVTVDIVAPVKSFAPEVTPEVTPEVRDNSSEPIAVWFDGGLVPSHSWVAPLSVSLEVEPSWDALCSNPIDQLPAWCAPIAVEIKTHSFWQ